MVKEVLLLDIPVREVQISNKYYFLLFVLALHTHFTYTRMHVFFIYTYFIIVSYHDTQKDPFIQQSHTTTQ